MNDVPHIFDARLRRIGGGVAQRRASPALLSSPMRRPRRSAIACARRRGRSRARCGAVRRRAPEVKRIAWTRGDAVERFVAPGGVVFEEEHLPFGEHVLDLYASVLTLHAVNDLPGAFVQIRRSLKPDSLFMAALFGGQTLHELRTALAEAEIEIEGGLSPRVAPFVDVRDAGALAAACGLRRNRSPTSTR